MSKFIDKSRHYAVADAVMIDAAKTKHGFFTEDKSGFITFSPLFNDPFADNWWNAIVAAETVTKDSVIIDQLAGLTENVELNMGLCRSKFQSMKFFIKKAFPGKRTVWNEFGFNDYEHVRKLQTGMILFMQELSDVSKKYKNQLISVGCTQAMINEILTLKNALDAANRSQEALKGGRPVLTESRIDVLNLAWDTTVDVCTIGKLIYADDEVMYNRYVLPSSEETGTKRYVIAVTDQRTISQVEIGIKGTNGKVVEIHWGDGQVTYCLTDGVNTNFYNHTYAVAGIYMIKVMKDVDEILEFHSNNSRLTSFIVPKNMKKIHQLILQNNNLPTESGDRILVTLNSFGTSGLIINLLNNAPLSSVGLLAKAELEARGCIVLVS